MFDALFAGHDFAATTRSRRSMQTMVDPLDDTGLDAETDAPGEFYASVRRPRRTASTSAEGKQQIIAELYEKFFKTGVQEAVRRARHRLHAGRDRRLHPPRRRRTSSRETFGRGLTDEDVHVLDPFTGTGTFITRLLQSGLITPHDLARKYANELHANEIMLLAYYIAAVNIEATYHALIGRQRARDYEPFHGIVLTDTFQITEAGDTHGR